MTGKSVTDKLDSHAAEISANLTLIKAAKAEIEALRARVAAYERANETRKEEVASLLEEAGLSRHGPFSIARKPPKVIVQDPDAVPDEFKEPQPDKILKARINANFKENGEIPPGCVLDNGGIMVRFKR